MKTAREVASKKEIRESQMAVFPYLPHGKGGEVHPKYPTLQEQVRKINDLNADTEACSTQQGLDYYLKADGDDGSYLPLPVGEYRSHALGAWGFPF